MLTALILELASRVIRGRMRLSTSGKSGELSVVVDFGVSVEGGGEDAEEEERLRDITGAPLLGVGPGASAIINSLIKKVRGLR